ncbi:S-adenosyl-L-methionine-dependent methyltransferase [Aspergillus karnatakaensis]|uniref:class I SAM-dependent methyltransferase n=1 Tax=Aspergillus karnatakaensis TaxID=1810916 RepID=UPI003CCD3CA9
MVFNLPPLGSLHRSSPSRRPPRSTHPRKRNPGCCVREVIQRNLYLSLTTPHSPFPSHRNLYHQTNQPTLTLTLMLTATGFITFEDTTIVPTLVSSASGVTLDLGPGAGNQIHNLASAAAQISHIYGVEPNPHYRVDIEAKLALEEHSALRGKYELITCGIEDSDVLREHGIEEGSVDCILCIQVLCAVKDPRSVARECWRLLRPGGKFVFWEHGGSRDGVVRVGQAVLNPAWSTFVGCRLTRNVLADILDAGEWENPGDVEEPEDRVSCMPRVQGVLVKRS